MKKFKSAFLATALTVASVGAFAQAASNPAATPGIDQRQAKQEARINQGVASGSLTGREANRLEKRQTAINNAENQAKSDGVVTKPERKRLHHMQDHNSRAIHHQKHDAQVKP